MNKTIARLLVSLVVLGVLFINVGPAKLGHVLLEVQPLWFWGAFIAYNSGQVVSALRWKTLGDAVGFETSGLSYIRIYFIGMFFGIAIPSTLGTDGTRALYLGRIPPGATRALSTVVGDRVIGLVTLMTVAALALLFGPRGDLPPILALALGLLSGGSLLAWITAPALASLLPEGNRLRELIRGDLLPLFRHPKLLGKAFTLSILVHLLHIAGQKFLTDALSLDVSWGFIAIYHPLIVLATAIPITIGGFGLREATYALLLPFAGIPADDAIVLSLLWWAVGALGGLLGGAIYAASGGAPAAPGRPPAGPATV